MLHCLLNLCRACLFVFDIKRASLTNVKDLHNNKREMNTAQAEGNVNSFLYSKLIE